MNRKVVICGGAGFLGKNIAKAIAKANTLPGQQPRTIQISSRHPERAHAELRKTIVGNELLPCIPVDITDASTLAPSFEGATAVVSLVGIMHGSPKMFEDVQWRGAENVARAARQVGAKLIHFSAIGADNESEIPYVRTKALAEEYVLQVCPDATIVRPSLVFGPEDDFFNRFSRLSKFLPFLPVFGGGTSRFQPVYIGDIARLVELITRENADIERTVSGKIVEAGGPDVLTYRQLMELVLKYSNRTRPIISLPFAIGKIQGAILERLPVNLFTVTRAQVEQLRSDNVVSSTLPANHVSLQEILRQHGSSLTPLSQILPTYL